MIKKDQSARMLVRLPPSLKEWLVREAGKNCSSYNSEIIRALRERKERAQIAASRAKAKQRSLTASVSAAVG